MGKFWVKLWTEARLDRKLLKLDHGAFRMFILCLMFAGDVDDEGYLPDLADIAWDIRESTEAVESWMRDLETAGLVYYDEEESAWVVTNWAKRNAAVPDAKRAQKYRNKQQIQDEEYWKSASKLPGVKS